MRDATKHISVAVDQHLETRLALDIGDLADVLDGGKTKDVCQGIRVVVGYSEVIEISDSVNDELATDSVHMHGVLCWTNVAKQCCITNYWH